MADRYRPLYHFTAAAGWINDPNGLLYFEGEYHLCYQYIPCNAEEAAGRPLVPHWGHAVSRDLLRWDHLPVALFPDHLGAIYSGSAVVDWHDTSGFFGGRPGLVAIFTHHNDEAAPRGPEAQGIAYSADRGCTWTPYAGNPVIGNPGVADFRDPKVFWYGPTGRWVMVVTYSGDRVRFYTSGNLRDWTLAGEFGAGQGAQSATWECPDLFELPVEGVAGRTQWVLTLSTYHATATAGRLGLQYFVGNFDGTTFVNAHPAATVLTVDHGPDDYAAVTFSDIPPADGRRLMVGWMNDWIYARAAPTEPWQGAMTIPRMLRLRRLAAGTRLVQVPIVELERLRGAGTHRTARGIAPSEGLWLDEPGDALEIVMVLQPGAATECGLRVVTEAGEHVTIGYDATADTLFVDRTHAGQSGFSPAFAARHGGPLAPAQGAITLRMFLDRCSVEVFGNDGECVVSSLFFPQSARRGLEVYALGGQAHLLALDVYPLRAP
jgi:fructan beta-fructosidase